MVNTYGDYTQYEPAVTIDAAGEFVIAWSSWGPDGSDWAVAARRFAANGTPLGEEFGVNTCVSGNQSAPSVATEPGGDFLIAWQSAEQDGSLLGVYAQHFAADGSPVGGEMRVNTVAAGEQSWPAVDMLSRDRFVVVWASGSYPAQDGSSYGIFVQLTGVSDINNHPNLTVAELTAPGDVYLDQAAEIALTIQNVGLTVAPPSTAHLWLSDDPTLGNGDDLDTGIDVPVPQLLCTAGNDGYHTSVTYSWPATDPFGTDRDYFFILVADSGSIVAESNENDNVGASNLAELRLPNLVGSISVPWEVPGGVQVPIEIEIWNSGEFPAATSVAHLWLSDDDVLGNADDIDLLIDVPVPRLRTEWWPDYSGDRFKTTIDYTFPSWDPFGTDQQYYFGLKLDVQDQVVESNEGDNAATAPFLSQMPNLVVADLAAPSQVEPGKEATVTVKVVNKGTCVVGPSTLHLWLSDDAVCGNADDYDLLIDVPVPDLLTWNGWEETEFKTDVKFTWPAVDPFLTDLRYHVVAKADAANQVAESNEDDNGRASSVVRLQAADLQAVGLRTASTVQLGQPLAANLQVRRLGLLTVAASTAHVWLSDNNAFGDADDVELPLPLDIAVPELAGDATWSANLTIPWPAADPFGTDGQSYVAVKLDYLNQVEEANKANNVVLSQPLTLVAPIDLDIQLAGHLGGASAAVDVQGSYAFELTSAGLRVLDVSDPTHVSKLAELVFPAGTALAIHAEGNRLYAADDAGFRVFNISAPFQPVLLAERAMPLGAQATVVFRGRVAFVADWRIRSSIFSTFPVRRAPVLSLSTPCRARCGGSGFGDTRAYVSYFDAGSGELAVEVIDVAIWHTRHLSLARRWLRSGSART